jgi:hypothetical protein
LDLRTEEHSVLGESTADMPCSDANLLIDRCCVYGHKKQGSLGSAVSPSARPVNPTTENPVRRAAAIAARMLVDCPEVEIPLNTPPGTDTQNLPLEHRFAVILANSSKHRAVGRKRHGCDRGAA